MLPRSLARAGFLTLVLALALLASPLVRAADEAAMRAALTQLRDADFNDKAQRVEQLAACLLYTSDAADE